MSNVYVAGSHNEIDRLVPIYDQIKTAGHTITFDWTRSNDEPCVLAYRCLDGVFDADRVVYVMGLTRSNSGGLIEVGVAIAHDMPVIALSPTRYNMFFELKSVNVVSTTQEMLDLL